MFQGKVFASMQTARFWRVPARLLLILAVVLSIWSFTLYDHPQPPLTPPPAGQSDGALYEAVAARVAAGQSYYEAAPAEHRARGFPLHPAVTVRPPLLAEVTALVGGPVAIGRLLKFTALVTSIAWALRFTRDVPNMPTRIAAMTLAVLSIVILTAPDLAMLHDIWAGMLVALALALRRPGEWGFSLVVALTAALLRELALPLLVVMGFSAVLERRWVEAGAWAAAFVVALTLLSLHWAHVAAITNVHDQVSAGWLRAMGWPWAVRVFSMTNLLQLLPAAIGSALVPFAILGWLTVERGLALRVGLWIIGMMCVFMVFGRDQNYYWGALVAPILPIGLAFAPAGIARVWRVAR